MSTGTDQPMWTAAQIAAALGVSKRTVLRSLAGIVPDGVTVAGGIETWTWSLSSLPESMRADLGTIATEKGYRSSAALLADPPAAWKPTIPLSAVAPEALDRATKLRRALQQALRMYSETRTASPVIATRGIADYAREFGHQISERHFWRVLKRTVTRDRGAENWDRLEIYISERPKQRRKDGQRGDTQHFQSLEETISIIMDPTLDARTRHTQKALLWFHTFELYENLASQCPRPALLKNQLLDFLNDRAPFLHKTKQALRRTFDRKFTTWKASDRTISVLLDQRSITSGWHRAPSITPEDHLHLVTLSCTRGGGLTQAWRESRRKGMLSPNLTTHYSQDIVSKSYVPQHIRDSLKYDIKIVKPRLLGPRAAERSGAFIHRHYDHLSGDWFVADDLTPPVYFWTKDNPNGYTRGNCLIMFDSRSQCILGSVLLADKAYNFRDVLRLITVVHDKYGLPRRGFGFERGVWKARAISGVNVPEWKTVDWEDTEAGLAEKCGLTIRYFKPHSPTSKASEERAMGLLQNLMAEEPGWCGRNERFDCPESLKTHLALIRTGKVPGHKFLMSQIDWEVRLHEIFEEFNNERQEGERLKGLSPAEAFERFSGEPLKQCAMSRFVFAAYQTEVKIRKGGISLTFAKEPYHYANELTGKLEGRKVIAWFHPENPDLLSVTDLEREIPFTVERQETVSEWNATGEELQEAYQKRAAHNAYGTRLCRAVKAHFSESFLKRMTQPAEISPKAEQLGRYMIEQRKSIEAKREKRRAKDTAAQRIAASHGIELSGNETRRDQQVESLKELDEFLSVSEPAKTTQETPQ